jgi:LacI family transcriptional regulator, repressor for deo operon, udp, cdd, tsx, nupC, and nupG
MATIEDVAALAGVSIATVSRVMNNSYIVSQDKREKVLAAAVTLHYQTSRSPARQSESQLILVAGSAFIYDVISGIQDKARENGYDVAFHYATNGKDKLSNTSLLTHGQIDGIILINYQSDEQELVDLLKQIPIVQCGGSFIFAGGITVSINNERAVCDIVRHLANAGRRRIALIMPEFADFKPYYMIEREKGYRLALQELRLGYDPDLIFSCDLSPESTEENIQRMLRMAERPDALICLNDSLGASFLIALRDHAVDVPGEIAVTGFDNDDLTEWLRPQMTSINQPRYEIGCECVRLLMAQMKDDNIIGRHVHLSHNLVIRDSSSQTRREPSI